jgi:hypothetical protein
MSAQRESAYFSQREMTGFGCRVTVNICAKVTVLAVTGSFITDLLLLKTGGEQSECELR